MSKKWLLILVVIPFVILSCNPNTPFTIYSWFINLCEECSSHGHAHAADRGYGYSTNDLDKFVKFVHNEYGGSEETIDIASPQIVPTSMPGSASFENTPLAHPGPAGDAYYDHEMDGARLGNLEVWFEGEYSRMKIPVIVSFNATNKNTAYASVAFPDLAQTIFDQTPVWRAGYTGAVKITPRSYPTTIDLSFTFNTKMMQGIIPVASAGKNLKITLTGYFQRSSDYFSFNNAASKGYDPAFNVDLNLFKRMTQTQGVEGLWMGGFVDSIYAGKDLGDLYHPITLLVKHIIPEYSGANYMTLLTHSETLNELKIEGKKLWVAESTSWGYAFDMELSGADKMVGKFLYRGTSKTADYTYTLYRIGFGGKKMKLKRATPSLVALGNTNNKPKLTIKGKGFAPGAMVYFSNPNIEIKDIQYVSSKVLKVTIQALTSIKKGQAIGIRVVNPDNSPVTKAGMLKTK